MTAYESLRAEIAGLSDSLRAARIDEFNAHAVEFENRLPKLVREFRDGSLETREDAAIGLRQDMLRMAALMELLAAYSRARLALEEPVAEAYGPSGSPSARSRRNRLQEA